MVVGVGEGQGTDAFIDCIDEEEPNEKRKWRFSAVLGRFAQTSDPSGAVSSRTGLDYEYKVKSSLYWPSNVVSGTVTSGYNKQVVEKFKTGSIITNLHSDTFSPTNDIGMQSPFTNAWVGGHQSRHVDLNKFDTSLVTSGSGPTLNNLDDQYSRPEAWRLLLRECPDPSGSGDGAMGFVGPDYGGPYPDYHRKYAVRYRDERTKRPVNIRNIRTTTGSAVHGNFVENYEVLQTFGRKQNDLSWRRTADAVDDVLSPFFDGLPTTTQEASLIGTSVEANATAVLTIADNVTLGDTISFSDDTITPVVVSTYDTRGAGANIVRAATVGVTRNRTKTKLESLYDVSVVIDGNRLLITNNKVGSRGNAQLTSSFTTASNFITGFSGGEDGGGNVVMNFNNTNRIPRQIREQQKFDADSRGKTVIATRFSAPGGFETMSEVYLDVPSKEYSVYNALPFRNLSVLSSGSGEAGTIRVDSPAGRREGLRTLLARHSGRFGIDSQYGSVVSENYNAEASFQKINRNSFVKKPAETIFTPSTETGIGIDFSNSAQCITSGSNVTNMIDSGSSTGFSFAFWAYVDSSSLGSDHEGFFFRINDDNYLSTGRNNLVDFRIFTPSWPMSTIILNMRDSSGAPSESNWEWANPFAQPAYKDKWVHFALTFENIGNLQNNSAKLYLNNSLYSISTATVNAGAAIRPVVDTTSQTAWFNTTTSSVNYADNLKTIALDEISWWNKQLSTSEVNSLYNNGRPLDLRTGSYSGLKHYWPVSSSSDYIVGTTSGQLFLEDVLSAGGDISGSHNSPVGDEIQFISEIYHYTASTTMPIESSFDNFNVSRPIPSQDYNYSWVTSSLGEQLSVRSGNQLVFGYWPKDGILSASANVSWRRNGFDSAVNFPTGSIISVRSL